MLMMKTAVAVMLSLAVTSQTATVSSAAVRTTHSTEPIRSEDPVRDHPTLRKMARTDPRLYVRFAANDTLRAVPFQPAYREFLNGGLQRAIELSKAEESKNTDFIDRVIRTYRVEESPRVHAAATAARSRGAQAQAEFVRSGFDKALQEDRHQREVKGDHERAIVEADRTFVRDLKVSAPGAHVRFEAGRATLPEAGDKGLVEFLTVTWAVAAVADWEAYSVAATSADTEWRRQVENFLDTARAAEAAVAESPAHELEAKKATAIRAWRVVGELALEPEEYLRTVSETVGNQIANWRMASKFSEGRDGPNWKASRVTVSRLQQSWFEEKNVVNEQRKYWRGIKDQAVAAENRIKLIKPKR